jgi:hypothetical protein
MKRMLIVLCAAGLLGAAAIGAGCSSSSSSGGGGASCTSSSKCSADPAPTSAEIMQCQMAQSDSKCGSDFTALLNCAYANQTCDSSGHTMQTTACNTQAMTYATCLSGGGTDAGGGG